MRNNICAIYARYSAIDALTGEGLSRSIENQINILTEYANENGFEIYKIYSDYHESGKNLERPQIQELLADADHKCFSTILVKDLSRFGRNYLEVGEYIDNIFPEKGLRFIAVNDHFDSFQYSDHLSIAIKNFMNAYYIKDIAKKIRRTMANRVEKESLISRKYGYIIANKQVEIDEEAALVVKKIYQLYLSGMDVGKIREYLTENKILTPHAYYLKGYNLDSFNKIEETKKYQWDYYAVRSILTDPYYIGDAVNFSSKYKKIRKSSLKRDVVLKNNHSAIIDEDSFNKVDRSKFYNKNMETRNKNLAHMIYNKRFIARGGLKHKASFAPVINDRNEEVYRCYGDKSEYPTDLFNHRIYDELIRRYKYICLHTKDYLNELFLDLNSTELSNDRLSQENKELQNKTKELFEKFINGEIKEDSYNLQIDSLRVKIVNNEKRMKDTVFVTVNEQDVKNKVSKFINLFYTSEDIVEVIKEQVAFVLYDSRNGQFEIVLKLEKQLNLNSKRIENMIEPEEPRRLDFDLKSMVLDFIRKNPHSKIGVILNEMKKTWQGFTYTSIKKACQKLEHDNLILLEGTARVCNGYIDVNYKDPCDYGGVKNLSQPAKNTYKAILENPQISIEEIANKFNITKSSARRNIRVLRDKGALNSIPFDEDYVPEGSHYPLFKPGKLALTAEDKQRLCDYALSHPTASRKEIADIIKTSEKTARLILKEGGAGKATRNGRGGWILLKKEDSQNEIQNN